MTKKSDIGNAPRISVPKESAAGAAAVVEMLKYAIGKAGIHGGATCRVRIRIQAAAGS